MSNENHVVKLWNGTEVSWEEFMSWPAKKQSANLKPTRAGCSLSLESRDKIRKSLLGRTTSRKGKPLSDKHKAAVSRSKIREVMTPQGLFNSRREFAAFLGNQFGISIATAYGYIQRYMRTNPSEYYYIKK